MTRAKMYLKILDWCIVRYGKSRYYDDFPDLDVDAEQSFGYLGEWLPEDCMITVYDKVIKFWQCSPSDEIKTIIHEYQHYLQIIQQYRIQSKSSCSLTSIKTYNS